MKRKSEQTRDERNIFRLPCPFPTAVSFNWCVYLCFRIMYTTSDIRSSCRIIPGLSREQLDLCYKANDVTISALDGLDLAMRECQLQVSHAMIWFYLQIHTKLPHTLNHEKEKRRRRIKITENRNALLEMKISRISF